MNTKELRRLLEEATPGPWVSFADEPDPLYCVASVGTGPGVVEICREPEHDERIADMALITAAVNALPDLLAIVETALDWRQAKWEVDSGGDVRIAVQAESALMDAIDRHRESLDNA